MTSVALYFHPEEKRVSHGARSQAKLDLNTKLQFERLIIPQLTRAFNKIGNDFVKVYSITGGASFVGGEEIDRLERILYKHYLRVGTSFASQLNGQMLKRLRLREYELAEIEFNLTNYYRWRTPVQARIITATTNRNINAAVKFIGQEQARVFQEEQRLLSNREMARLGGFYLKRRFRSRINIIAAVETQAASENAKQAELEVMIGLDRSVKIRARGHNVEVAKEWVSTGDSRVRDHHLTVDSVQTRSDEAFTVLGEKLRFPGDTSLGATDINISNCRCAVVRNVRSVATARQDLSSFVEVEDLTVDVSRFRLAAPSTSTLKGQVVLPKPGISEGKTVSTISFDTGTIPETVTRVTEAFESHPEIVRDLLHQNGIKIRVGKRMTKINKSLKGHPYKPGQKFDAKAWDGARGMYDPKTKTIYLPEEQYIPNTTFYQRQTVSLGDTLAHEMGHALDDALGHFSSTDEFQKAYRIGADKILSKPISRKRLGYYVQANGIGEKETFAEVYALMQETGGTIDPARIRTFMLEYKQVKTLIKKALKRATAPIPKLPTTAVGKKVKGLKKKEFQPVQLKKKLGRASSDIDPNSPATLAEKNKWKTYDDRVSDADRGTAFYREAESEAVDAYIGDSAPINNYLRSGKFEFEEFADLGDDITEAGVKEFIGQMDDAIAKSTIQEEATVLRGIDGDVSWIKNVKPGLVVEDKAFGSWTLDTNIGVSFADPIGTAGSPAGRTLIRARLPKKHKGLFVGMEEQEVILARGTKYRVESIEHNVSVLQGLGGKPVKARVITVEIEGL